ncbi:serine hydroxymethyltransferase [Brevundimonas diminuta]|uniref:serine hydroxymethyltransferase n=1 Tax=Brevundimonas diminuta TaxID=293 RepID=UPI0020973CE8|nr:serine hydroxymethyltransferase [Brevundimonas diminuta]MCO8019159.1 serine hydroxymethyltransferase [Brevundimonas diminuta]MCO8021836.1 serine hydroxymethyltransferase [Brevundimonas diminuta]
MHSDLAARVLDPELAHALSLEQQRQQDSIELIASENIVSAAVRQAQGSVLTNKYAEGYPGRRYYGGCEAVDIAEKLAIERACALFDVDYANVQPHSGVNANLAVMFALIKPGDRIMGLDLACGGHLTHGSPVSLSGQWFEVSAYRVREDNDLIDYDDMERRVLQDRPKLIYAGGSAYPRRIDFARMRQIADKVGAWLVADVAHYAGLIAAGLYPNPTPHAHVTTSTTHKTLRGPRGGLVLCNDPELARRIDKAVFPGTQGGPLMHVIAGKAAAFHEAQQPSFVDYSRAVIENARVLGETLAEGGLRLVSGGTDCHLVLVDLRPFGVTGKQAVEALEAHHLIANKNSVPFDTASPMITSGLRLGSPSSTSRGFDAEAFRTVGGLILSILRGVRGERPDSNEIRAQVAALTGAYPLTAPGAVVA